ncbi:glutamine amidotransferase [Pantoea sp. 1.19]|uniref:glutamine amidotransferase n=1 Tax=Pantoea sp. 1.19 TaxID=1925589 RepID=UPI000948DD6A|nr:glutamine amidotransferase [Pantoea sp. 1.19]
MRRESVAPLAIIQLQPPPERVRQQIGEQHQWFIAALDLQPGDYQVCRPDLGEALPAPSSLSAAIICGSWAMVTDHDAWCDRMADWVRLAVSTDLPLLGVCYGHQLMAWALGGEVADNPNGWERGLQQILALPPLASDPLLQRFPAQFSAWLSHRQSVITPPRQAQVLARSALDGCQILRYSDRALSVQFHPEFTGEMMTACLTHALPPGGVVSLMCHQEEPHWARELLLRFWQQVAVSPSRALAE